MQAQSNCSIQTIHKGKIEKAKQAAAMSTKMVHATKLVFLFLFLVVQGHGQGCNLSDIVVNQVSLGKGNGMMDFTFEVETVNQCACTVSNVHVKSDGFNSYTLIDPSEFRRDGDAYLLNDGKPLGSNGSVKFTYTYDHAFEITPKFWNEDHC